MFVYNKKNIIEIIFFISCLLINEISFGNQTDPHMHIYSNVNIDTSYKQDVYLLTITFENLTNNKLFVSGVYDFLLYHNFKVCNVKTGEDFGDPLLCFQYYEYNKLKPKIPNISGIDTAFNIEWLRYKKLCEYKIIEFLNVLFEEKLDSVCKKEVGGKIITNDFYINYFMGVAFFEPKEKISISIPISQLIETKDGVFTLKLNFTKDLINFNTTKDFQKKVTNFYPDYFIGYKYLNSDINLSITISINNKKYHIVKQTDAFL